MITLGGTATCVSDTGKAQAGHTYRNALNVEKYSVLAMSTEMLSLIKKKYFIYFTGGDFALFFGVSGHECRSLLILSTYILS